MALKMNRPTEVPDHHSSFKSRLIRCDASQHQVLRCLRPPFPGRTKYLSSAQSKSARSSLTVGADAVDALWRVPGIDAVELLEDAEEEHGRAKLSYLYMGEQRFQTIDSHLDQFGLRRVKVEGP